MTTTTTTTLTDPVGPVEISQRLGVSLNTVHSWRTRARTAERGTGLPAPDATCSNTPLWSWATIAEWARATGRLT
jgi:transposase-like protein